MLRFRKIEVQDAKSLSDLARSVFSMPWSENAFAHLAEDPDSIFYVALEEDVLIGGCGLTHIGLEGDIHNVMVAPEYRGRGVATRMLSVLLEEGEKQGIQEFTLEVRVSNVAAIKVYEKLGFVSEGIRPRFYEQPVEDAMIMWKR